LLANALSLDTLFQVFTGCYRSFNLLLRVYHSIQSFDQVKNRRLTKIPTGCEVKTLCRFNQPLPAERASSQVAAPLKSVLTTCFVRQASCDYGRIDNAYQSKLHLSLVSTLKASKGYEEEFQACGDG